MEERIINGPKFDDGTSTYLKPSSVTGKTLPTDLIELSNGEEVSIVYEFRHDSLNKDIVLVGSTTVENEKLSHRVTIGEEEFANTLFSLFTNQIPFILSDQVKGWKESVEEAIFEKLFSASGVLPSKSKTNCLLEMVYNGKTIAVSDEVMYSSEGEYQITGDLLSYIDIEEDHIEELCIYALPESPDEDVYMIRVSVEYATIDEDEEGKTYSISPTSTSKTKVPFPFEYTEDKGNFRIEQEGLIYTDDAIANKDDRLDSILDDIFDY